MPDVDLGAMPEQGKDAQTTINNLYDSYVALRRLIEYYLENLDQSNVPNYYGIFNNGNEAMFDNNGYNPAYLRWFTNIWANSEFTVYDGSTYLPYLWTGTGVTSSNAAAFIGERSMKITAGSKATYTPDSAYGNTYINPSWFTMIATRGFISFWSKGGQARLRVKDNTSGNYITLKDINGVEATTIDFTALTNWQSNAHFCTFAASTYTDLRPEITDIGVTDLYINAPQASYDRTAKYSQLYLPGKHSIGIGGAGSNALVKDYNATNANEIVVDTSEDTIVTKTFTLDTRADVKVIFTCQGIASAALSLTLKTYIDNVARTLQPVHDIFGANNALLTLTDSIMGQAAGSHTVKVTGTTSTGTYTIAAHFATVDILTIPTISDKDMLDVTSFVLTVIDDDEIDAAWVNPTLSYFTGVELYRYATTLAVRDRAWCAANATLVYSGAGTSYNNTGLTALTTYFYKIFAVYEDAGTFYSEGINLQETTLAPACQAWAGHPDSPLYTVDWPYQCIVEVGTGSYRLIMSKGRQTQYLPISAVYIAGYGSSEVYIRSTGAWSFYQEIIADIGDWGLIQAFDTMEEANNDVYTDAGLGTVYFAKTT
jgi:hypothetical protein